MKPPEPVVRVAIKTPLNHLFDYLPPSPNSRPIPAGVRVRVPFGRGKTIGVVVATADHSAVGADRLRRITEVIDAEPLLDATLMGLLTWAASYYQQPPGEVYAAALPRLLRGGRQPVVTETVWRLTAAGRNTDIEALRRRAPRQAAALKLLSTQPAGTDAETMEAELGRGWRPVLRNLEDRDWVLRQQRQPGAEPSSAAPVCGPELTDEQQFAVTTVLDLADRFGVFVLNGITGSGKTEVYLQLIEHALRENRQTLVLVPEIGLTPQLVNRFRKRLERPLAVMHSGLTDKERLKAWQAARDGSAGVVVGTRSAVFVPLMNPGLIIIDEEHDLSYKQQEGFRYSARDLAVMRAQRHNIPVMLGSATPSLETLHNVSQDRYTQLDLRGRPGGAELPSMQLIDMRLERSDGGLSPSLVAAMRRHLAEAGQVLLFLNRRGFAPALFCPDCGWTAPCKRCDARMTLHQRVQRLRCHHCGSERRPETSCPDCQAALMPVGMGTERIEETIGRLFPDHELVRIDRDTTRGRGTLESLLGEINRGERRILIGTQMLTKGHHFPDVTLVGIIDADQGLFGTDPRSNERLAQLVIQVAGRAGRAQRPGQVLIQTRCPEHPLLTTLIEDGYGRFAEAALREREAAGWPPYTALALLRANSEKEELPLQFLVEARELAGNVGGIQILGPAPAQMPRRAGRYRAQLLIQGARGPLQSFLSDWTPRLGDLKIARRVRWSLDVDPVELF